MIFALFLNLAPFLKSRCGQRQSGVRLQLMRLEERTLPSIYFVSNDNDTGKGSLRDAIEASNNRRGINTIEFTPSLDHGTISLSTADGGELLISSNLNIEGPGADLLAITGNRSSRIFEIAAGFDVAITGLTLTDGFAQYQSGTELGTDSQGGGAVLNDGRNLLLARDTFSHNVVSAGTTDDTAQGGAVQSLSGNLTLSDCIIENNQALGAQGTTAVGDANGGGISVLSGTLRIDGDSVVSKNEAAGGSDSAAGLGSGGGIYILAGGVSIINSTIAENTAIGGDGSGDGFGAGGGLYVAKGARVSIDKSPVTGNAATGGNSSSGGLAAGGGIDTSANITLTGEQIANNVAAAGTGTPNNSALGGGLYSTAAVNSLSACTFSNNNAIGGKSGIGADAGNAEGGAIDLLGAAAISGSTFTNNQATAGDSGTFNTPGSEDPVVDYGFGGAIANTAGVLHIVSCTFASNVAQGGNDASALGTDVVRVGGAEGGAVFNEIGSTATLVSCAFDTNRAQAGNGDTGTVGTTGIVLAADGLGGSIASGFGGSKPTGVPDSVAISGTSFSQNMAIGGNDSAATGGEGLVGDGVGGGIANIAGGTARVTRSTLYYNQATSGVQNSATGSSSLFANLGAGGAVFNYLGSYSSTGFGQLGPKSTTTVTDCAIDYNLAEGQGGDGEGGGIADVLSSTTVVTGSALTMNQASDAVANSGLGGGIFNDAESTLALTNSQVTSNLASGSAGRGGGIYYVAANSLTSKKDLIKGNSAAVDSDIDSGT